MNAQNSNSTVRPGKSRWRCKPSTLGVLAFVVLVVFFSPSIIASGWRLWKHGTIIYQGKKIPVPTGWIEAPPSWSDTDGVTLMMLPATILGGSPSSVMSFAPVGPTAKPTYEGWQHSIDVVQKRLGNSIVGPEKIGSGQSQSVCMSAYPSSGHGAIVSCLLFDRAWKADYIGSKEGVSLFLETIRKIT